MWGVRRFVFSAQNGSDLCTHTSGDLVRSVYDIPLVLRIFFADGNRPE
jgi:hypothetical protein